MNDEDVQLADIACNAARMFKEMGWRWTANDNKRTGYIPDAARIVLKLVRTMKDMRDDPAILSASSGRLTVERVTESKDSFQISIELGTIHVGEDDEEATV